MKIQLIISAFIIVLALGLDVTTSSGNGVERLFSSENINTFTDESVILNTITSIVVSASMDDGVVCASVDALKSHAEYFKKMEVKSLSASSCMEIANYLKRIQPISCPSNLVHARLHVYRYSFGMITNSCGKISEELKPIINRKVFEEQMRQMRFYNANKNIEEYRKAIFSMCGQGVCTACKTMSEEEFSYFTNQIVKVSRASQDEQKVLFRRLKKE